MVSINRRSILKTTASVGIIGGLAGCADNEEDEPPAEDDPEEEPEEELTEDEADETDDELAGVRVAHLSPDAPNVDVYVDDEPVLEDVAFGDVSEYLELDAGSYDVGVTPAGEDETVFEETLEIEAEDYTLAALGELAEENQPFDVAVFEDDLSDPGEEARVRVIHAAPDAPAVDITLEATGDVLFEDLEFGEAETGDVPADEYALEVRPADNEDAEPVETFEVTVAAGTVYTGFAIGYLEPDDAPADEPFDLEVTEDSVANEEMDDEEMHDDTPDDDEQPDDEAMDDHEDGMDDDEESGDEEI